MEPRFRGAKAIIARSFARIHETNLKKQGVLPLTFADPADLRPDRRGRPHLDRSAWPTWPPTSRCTCRDHQARRHDRSTSRCTHTMNAEQIEWFRAGGALNIIRQKNKGRACQESSAAIPVGGTDGRRTRWSRIGHPDLYRSAHA